MALRHHERRFATRSAHTIEANISHDIANHPAHQRHAAFTPACFALPSGTAPRKRTFHQGRANAHGAATSRTSCRHTVRRPLEANVAPDTTDTPRLHQHVSRSQVARRHANAFPTKAAQIPMALRHYECNFATGSAHRLEAFRTRRPPKYTRTVSKTSVSYETSSKSHASSLQDERFVRDFLQKSRVQSPKRAFRARLPPKVTLRVCKTSVSYETCSKSHTCQVCKTSVSCETSSKSHTSSLQNEHFARDFLQNERFVRDFLQKSHVKSAKRAFRTRLPQKVTRQVSKTSVFVRDFLKNSHVKVCKTSVSYETSSKSQAETPHITQPCQAVSRFQPLQTTPAHTPIPMSQRHSPLPQLTTSQFPAPATNLSTSTRLTRTKYCEVPRLPRKVTISYHVSFNKICTAPHVWNDFDPF